MRLPRIVTHIFDSESKTATLGYMIYVTASAGLFIPAPAAPSGHIISADAWLICTAISAALIGGKLVGETVLAAKLGKLSKEALDAPPTPPAAQ